MIHVQAFQELNKGEQTASALEKQLSAMEAKIDELLAAAEKTQKDIETDAKSTPVDETQ